MWALHDEAEADCDALPLWDRQGSRKGSVFDMLSAERQDEEYFGGHREKCRSVTTAVAACQGARL